MASSHPPGMRSFITVWLGQTVSVLGSGLTAFALGVWVYSETGSVTRFALISVFTVLPGIVISPLVGALVDRWDRRRTMILSDSGAGLITALIAFLIFSGRLEIWHLYVLLASSSLFNAFQYPAFAASTTLLVGRENLGRAAGMTQLGEAAGMVLAPLLAPLLWAQIDLAGVMLVDVATFLVAVTTLLAIRIPRPERSAASREQQASLAKEAAFGWTFIRRRSGLLGLLVLFAGGNMVLGFVQVLITPLVLEMASPTVLGRVLAMASLGMVAGGIVMSVWGGPRRRVRGIVVVTALQGLVLLAGATVAHPTGIAIVAFVFMFGGPFVVGSSQAIWQSKVEPDLQGRVFAIRRMVALLALPLAYAAAGPLSDHLFEPLLAPSGPLASSVGTIFGTGPGRGIALFLSLLGLFLVTSAALAHRYGPLRRLEAELPDVIPSSGGRRRPAPRSRS